MVIGRQPPHKTPTPSPSHPCSPPPPTLHLPRQQHAVVRPGALIARKGITKDIVSRTAAATAPDMGADEFSPITLNLTAFIEGYYTGGTPPMRNVLEQSGVIGATSTQCDTITVQLRNSTFPYAVAASFTGDLTRWNACM
ncbi:MAG: hypothetical protein IPK25_13365 [Saprospiraceae bacterium]|nr:hypothetical protein [Saprospiraceae bacterium]